MTPAAPSFGSCSPKTKFRGVQKRFFGTEQMTTGNMRKSSRLRMEQKRTNQRLCSVTGSPDEEYRTPKKKKFSSSLTLDDCKPSTSGKCFGDSHIEISDEDGDTSECVEKTEGDSIGKFDDPCRDESNETVLNDRYLLDGHNPRNFYIVKSDGRPAEMFRTDLFEKVRKGIDADLDSDDDYVPGSGLARITDRWRPEWSSGTQVPMQPNISKCSEVRQATVGQDSPCSTSVQFKRRQLMKKFLIEPFKKPISSPLRLYECTILDVQWLQLLNERLCNSAMSELPMEVFLEIMNDFEIECYKNIHRKLLEPLHSPSYQGVEQDEEAACDICRICECEPDDEMVFCDGCNLCFHMSCYGLQELPPDEWLCMKCRICPDRNPTCVLCPTTGGAIKCVDGSDEWAHVVCALWIHECRFVDFEKREPITCINQIKEERWLAKCAVCDTRQGACIKCSVDSCKTWFHVTCALRSGMDMRIEQDPDDDKVNMISMCPRHHSTKPFIENLQASSDDEADGSYRSGFLRQLEQSFYLYVSCEKTAERLEQDPAYVALVFEYWKLKRSQLNDGKPLIDNLQDEVRVDEPIAPQLELPAPATTPDASVTPTRRCHERSQKHLLEPSFSMRTPANVNGKEMDVYQKLLDSLQKGRNMLNLVVQQCQTKHTFILVHLKTVMMILDHISRPVPLSHRKIAYFNGILKYLSSKSNDAEDETEEDFSRNSSSTEESCSQRNVYESCLPSPSSINSNRPRLRSMSRLSKKQEGKNIELPTKLSRQSQMDSLSHGKRNAEQCLSSTDQLREQESIQRRKSLRSWSGKSKKEDGGNATQNCTTKDMSEIPSINVQSLRSHSDAGMSKTKSRGRVEISDGSVGNSSADEASFLSNGKRRRVLSRSESKNYQKPDLSSCKNRGNVAEKCSREVRLLRSLNMKDVNKSVDNSIDNSAIDKEGDRLKEFRILRSRSSFPPMEPVHKEQRSQSKLRSGTSNGVRQSRALYIQ